MSYKESGGGTSGKTGNMDKAWWPIWSGRDKGAEAGKSDSVSDACLTWGETVLNSKQKSQEEGMFWDGEFSFP